MEPSLQNIDECANASETTIKSVKFFGRHLLYGLIPVCFVSPAYHQNILILLALLSHAPSSNLPWLVFFPHLYTGTRHLVLTSINFTQIYCVFNPKHTGEDKIAIPCLFLRFAQKIFRVKYDETLCKFLLYTYEDSHNLIWSKKLSRGHVEYVYVSWVNYDNFKNCNFRVLRRHNT